MNRYLICVMIIGFSASAFADEVAEGFSKTKGYQQFAASAKCSLTTSITELTTDNGNRSGTSNYIGIASCGKSSGDDRYVSLFSSSWESGKANLEIQEIPSKINSVVKSALNPQFSCEGVEPQKGNRWIKAYRSADATNGNFSFYKDATFSVPADIYLDQEACEKGKGGVSWATNSCADESGQTIQGPCCCIGG